MSAYESINAQANAAIDELLEAADTLKTGGKKKIVLLENDLPDNY